MLLGAVTPGSLIVLSGLLISRGARAGYRLGLALPFVNLFGVALVSSGWLRETRGMGWLSGFLLTFGYASYVAIWFSIAIALVLS